jgi:hypothetical protein
VFWYDFAGGYVDMNWGSVSGKHHRGIAAALATVT